MPVNILGFDFLHCLILAAHVEDNFKCENCFAVKRRNPSFFLREMCLYPLVCLSVALLMSLIRGDLCVRDGGSEISESFCV